MKIGRITVSDRASAGIYEDKSGPEIERLLSTVFGSSAKFVTAIVPDEAPQIAGKLCEFSDHEHCALIVTTGGTGISARDVTPEATRAILEKELPGFGEIMRMQSFPTVRTAILSRATAGTRGTSLIVNLPGKPSAVAECLGYLAPALREGIAHLQGKDPHTQPSSTT